MRGGGQLFLAHFPEGEIFFNALFCELFFHESDITCIITVVRAQQQHKGEGGGGGKKFPTVSWGAGGVFFLRICEGGAFFWLSILPNHHPSPGHI